MLNCSTVTQTAYILPSANEFGPTQLKLADNFAFGAEDKDRFRF
jgi:hypothetical protein